MPVILPFAVEFAEQHETLVLRRGEPLSEARLADAKQAGVQYPEKIRIMAVDELPLPKLEEALYIAKRMGLFQSNSAALTLRYGIYLRKEFWVDRLTLVHELVHVAQYERMGGIKPFLEAYLLESLDPGYPFGRLQQEAILVAKNICKSDI